MANLNQLELQNLRELIAGHETASNKLQDYAHHCSDPQLKQMFQQSASICTQHSG